MNYMDYIEVGGTIVQIGAFDGVAHEDFGLRELIFTNELNCHLIEPQENEFVKLKQNYDGAKATINFHNFAIYTQDGTMEFKILGAMSSFVDTQFFSERSDWTRTTVETKLLKTFVQENNITKINGLFLDVEGVEDVVFNQLFEDTSIRPDVIRYEWYHVKDKEKLEDYIKQNGYTIYPCDFSQFDKICVRNDLVK